MKSILKFGLILLGALILFLVLFSIFVDKQERESVYPFGLTIEEMNMACEQVVVDFRNCSENYIELGEITECTYNINLYLEESFGVHKTVSPRIIAWCWVESFEGA